MKILISVFVIFLSFGGLTWAQSKPSEITNQKTDSGFDQWQFGIGGSFSASTKLKFPEGTVDSNKFDADLDYSGGLSVELEARLMKPVSWGFQGGVVFDGERKLTGGLISTADERVTLSSADPSKIQATIIYGNAVYRWNQFYLPFGFNISSIKYTTPSNFSGTSSANGGLGAQLGVGVYINDNFVMEAFSRVVTVKLTSENKNDLNEMVNTNWGTGSLSNIMITAKYIF